ncbi:MAG: class II aldolase/adducin family protein [Synergistaceae bacterium]|nr:class II aldolase/adducin family protein [Synergistaceae bacterium]
MNGLREKIISAALEMRRSGLVRGTSGNISARTDHGFLITPSGMAYESLVPEDLPEMDFMLRQISGDRKPSIEKEMHGLILKNRNDVSAVVHVHSVYASAVASARKDIPVITDNVTAFFGCAVPCAEYAPAGSPELARNVLSALGGGFGVLLANHGALCVGVTPEEALLRCEILEETAKIYVLSQLLGGAVALDNKVVTEQYSAMQKNYGQTR